MRFKRTTKISESQKRMKFSYIIFGCPAGVKNGMQYFCIAKKLRTAYAVRSFYTNSYGPFDLYKFYGSIATFITPSRFSSNSVYAASVSRKG